MSIGRRRAVEQHRTRGTRRPRRRVHAEGAVRAPRRRAPPRVMPSGKREPRTPPSQKPELDSLEVRPSRRQRRSLAYLAELEGALAVHPASVDPLPRWIGRVRAPDPQHRVAVVLEGRASPLPVEEEEVDDLLRVVARRR